MLDYGLRDNGSILGEDNTCFFFKIYFNSTSLLLRISYITFVVNAFYVTLDFHVYKKGLYGGRDEPVMRLGTCYIVRQTENELPHIE